LSEINIKKLKNPAQYIQNELENFFSKPEIDCITAPAIGLGRVEACAFAGELRTRVSVDVI
jgi:hypothetical protein